MQPSNQSINSNVSRRASETSRRSSERTLSPESRSPGKSNGARMGVRKWLGSIMHSETPKPQKSLPPPRSRAFSANGNFLLLWTKGENYVFASVIPAGEADLWHWCPYVVPGAQMVAGGKDQIAVVCKVFIRIAIFGSIPSRAVQQP